MTKGSWFLRGSQCLTCILNGLRNEEIGSRKFGCSDKIGRFTRVITADLYRIYRKLQDYTDTGRFE